MPRVHHTAICTNDVETSLRFWRDGIGFEVTMDLPYRADWPVLFDAPSDQLRAIFLSHSADQRDLHAGLVELVDLGPLEEGTAPAAPTTGFFLVSLYEGSSAGVQAVLDRLAALGLGGEPRRVDVHGVDMAVVVDPNGVRVELIGLET